MSRKTRSLALLLAAGALLLAACGSKNASNTPTPDANAVYTAAAATVGAALTQSAALTPSPTATTAPTDTPEATATQATPPTNTPSTPSAPVSTTPPNVPDQATLYSETIPDGTKIDPGAGFTKMWTLKNTGTTTWSTSYSVVFYAGSQMGAPNSTNLVKSVAPGDTVQVSINLTAPTSPGKYTGWFVLRNADGTNFYPVSVVIEVGAVTATNTAAPTKTPAPATNTPEPATATPTETSTP
jgi:hypothetical protein